MMRDEITKRRMIGGGLAIALFGSGGWWVLDRNDPDPLADLPEPVHDANFEWSRNPTEYANGEDELRTEYPEPQISTTDGTVDISGVLCYGSSSCNIIAVADIAVVENGAELRAEVSWKKAESEKIIGTRSCTDDLDYGSYELRLDFGEELPATVHAAGIHRAPAENEGEVLTQNRYRL